MPINKKGGVSLDSHGSVLEELFQAVFNQFPSELNMPKGDSTAKKGKGKAKASKDVVVEPAEEELVLEELSDQDLEESDHEGEVGDDPVSGIQGGGDSEERWIEKRKEINRFHQERLLLNVLVDEGT